MVKQTIAEQPQWHNLVDMFYSQAEIYHNRSFLHQRSTEEWSSISWGDAAQKVSQIAKGLKQIGILPGDRVIIVSENRMEWGLLDLAIMAVGAVMVPAYTTNTTEDHRHIVEDSGASAAFISTNALFKNFLPAAVNAQRMHSIITLENISIAQNPGINLLNIDELCHKGTENDFNPREEARRIEASSLACLIYTSGTGGAPKGVMLEHNAILVNCHDVYYIFKHLKQLNFYSILPLSHAFEHTVGLLAPIYYGAEIYYTNGIENLLPGLQEVKPGILLAVPRIYEMFKIKIEGQLKKASPNKQKAYQNALNLGLKRVRGEKFSLSEKIKFFFLRKLVQKKIQKTFGNLGTVVSGGAALDPAVGEWVKAMDFPLVQGYGQTEAAPIISANPFDEGNRYDTTGIPMNSMTVKINHDAELLVKGRNVMRGYWNNRRATAETIIDGWLHTGDLAKIDEDGHIIITGRKKDIIVLSGGDNVSPARIESLLTLEHEISQAVIFGDKQNYLVALIVPDQDWLDKWAKENNKSSHLKETFNDTELNAALLNVIKRVNQNLAILEKVRKIAIIPEVFSMDNGLLTPTLKVRRHIIISKYMDELNKLYNKK